MIRKILYTITIVVAIVLICTLFDFFSFSKEQDKLAFQKGESTSLELKKNIDSVLSQVMQNGLELKKTIEQNQYSTDKIEGLLIEESNKLETILGVTIAYEKNAFNPEKKYYAPYYDKNKAQLIYVGEIYDYTDTNLETTSWYTNTKQIGPHWTEPYYAQAAQALVSDYSIPFYYPTGPKKGEFRGVVSMTISLNGFKNFIHTLSLGKTGFGFVTSPKGQLLAHPVTEYVGLKNIQDLINEELNPALKPAYTNILKNKSGNLIFTDAIKNQKALFFYDNVTSSNWKIGIQYYKNDLLDNQDEYKRKYINISLISSLLFILLLAVFYNRDYLSKKETWYLSIISSSILIANICLVGYLQHTKASVNIKNDSPPITDKTSLNNVVNSQQLKVKELGKAAKRIVPTGIYIEQLQFEDSYNVSIGGYLWMKYNHEFIDQVETGFLFPQTAPFAESSFIEKVYEKKEKNYTLIGYNFRTTLRLNFDYSDYPFDKRNIDVEIIPANETNNILLVPDLESYTYNSPKDKKGINYKIKLSGSKILETYFNYTFFSYNTNFGFKENATFEKAPILHFNVNVREVLITAFVTYLIPIFVTLIMIFIFIFSTPRSKDGRIDGGAIVQGMAAFFFVLIFSHIDLRKSIETADLMYMEYFYFVTYIIIVLATYNLITFSRIPHKLFDYEDNIIVKATYFPMFLLMVLVITLGKFY